MPYLIAYDLGTGGIKASLYRDDGVAVGWAFFEYATRYPREGFQEQRPDDWWQGVCSSTTKLLADSGIPARDVAAVALSGHSLVAAPLDRDGNLLVDSVPIWSDTRASVEAVEFFTHVPYDSWYMTTGNGDPPETYSTMKLMWLKKHRPEIWARTAKVVGSKDYVNFRLTGNIATDYSYASGSGMFNLLEWRYDGWFASAAGITQDILPDILDSHAVVGRVTRRASEECGLAEGTLVACGGVDNACMALGARGLGEGRAYTSLGSSSWIAVTSTKPILDLKTLPFVFTHIEKGYYTSGVSIFSAGSAWRWARDELCRDISGEDSYVRMNELAASAPAGANGVLFNPTLSGGSSQNVSTNVKGAFAGITLATTRNDMLRAVLEGVAMDLKCYCLDALKKQVSLDDTMLLCGGGAKSPLWRQIFADVFGMNILKTNIDQDAASLGAAAIAARAAGLWTDYSPIDELHKVEQLHKPDPENRKKYDKIMETYRVWTEGLAKIHSS
jgi:xylulokinase